MLGGESSGGGAYAELVVPDDYEGTLVDVEDYDKTKQGKSRGWVFHYDVQTPSGKTCRFKSWLSFGQNARWKLLEVMEAHEVEMELGLNEVDPNSLIGDVIGLHIDFPRDKNTDEPNSPFREIKQHFALVEAPEVEERGTPDPEAPDTVAEAPAEIF